MDYPNNRLIVNGVDLTQKFQMILADGYTLTPPSIKTYTVDIPGGHGKLDLTEALFGDVAYNNRKQEFIFYLINAKDFEKAKTDISTMLHGKYFEYKMTMDPEYTYKGRFTIDSYSHTAFGSGNLGEIKISIDADPFKYKKDRVFVISAIGGETYSFESGRKRVLPSIETDGLLKVIYNGKLFTLPKGTWKLNELVFNSGQNEVYFNSFDVRNLTWGQLRDTTNWGQFKEKKLYEWYKSNGDGTYVFTTWDSLDPRHSWEYYRGKAWKDIVYMWDKVKDVSDSYIKYEWGDL